MIVITNLNCPILCLFYLLCWLLFSALLLLHDLFLMLLKADKMEVHVLYSILFEQILLYQTTQLNLLPSRASETVRQGPAIG